MKRLPDTSTAMPVGPASLVAVAGPPSAGSDAPPPASRYPALKRWLLEGGARFQDIAPPPRSMQEAWADVDLDYDSNDDGTVDDEHKSASGSLWLCGR